VTPTTGLLVTSDSIHSIDIANIKSYDDNPNVAYEPEYGFRKLLQVVQHKHTKTQLQSCLVSNNQSYVLRGSRGRFQLKTYALGLESEQEHERTSELVMNSLLQSSRRVPRDKWVDELDEVLKQIQFSKSTIDNEKESVE